MNDSPKQPLAKGWDDILNVLAAADRLVGPAFRRYINARIHKPDLDFVRWGALVDLGSPAKQPLAKGRPPIHTTVAENNPLRRVPGRQKGTT